MALAVFFSREPSVGFACNIAADDADMVAERAGKLKKKKKDFRTAYNLYEMYKWTVYLARCRRSCAQGPLWQSCSGCSIWPQRLGSSKAGVQQECGSRERQWQNGTLEKGMFA